MKPDVATRIKAMLQFVRGKTALEQITEEARHLQWQRDRRAMLQEMIAGPGQMAGIASAERLEDMT